MKELIAIQNELKAPKGQTNNFGKYKYRSCEDILEAVKPLCVAHGCLLTISDEMIMLGDRFYVKATSTITFPDGSTHSVSAYAREAEIKKGMDSAQITGATSSYSRKYSLNGLFCIDDTKDADTMDNTTVKPQTVNKPQIPATNTKLMTSIQKSTLKDQIVKLDKVGSESSQKAITAINELLGYGLSTFDDAAHMINRCKLTIDKGGNK